MAAERLQKLLARAGIASRRAAEALILAGRVRVNGRVVRELGQKADPQSDRVEVDGQRVVSETPVYYVLNKPREVVTTVDDPEGRATVSQLMKRVPERLFPVGRLDYHTSGVLLMTNDGELTHALLHPKKGVPKTYIAKVKGSVPIKHLEQLRRGVTLDGGERTRPAEVFVANEERGNTWLQITISEGKNRQIHRMLEAVGHRVMRLSRLAFAGITIEGLPPGAYRPLASEELRKLKRDYRNPSRRARAAEQRERTLAAGLPGEPEGEGRVQSQQPSRTSDGQARRTKPAPRRGVGSGTVQKAKRGASTGARATARKQTTPRKPPKQRQRQR